MPDFIWRSESSQAESHRTFTFVHPWILFARQKRGETFSLVSAFET